MLLQLRLSNKLELAIERGKNFKLGFFFLSLVCGFCICDLRAQDGFLSTITSELLFLFLADELGGEHSTPCDFTVSQQHVPSKASSGPEARQVEANGKELCVSGWGRRPCLERVTTLLPLDAIEPGLGLLGPHWGKPNRNPAETLLQGWDTEEYKQLPRAQEEGLVGPCTPG